MGDVVQDSAGLKMLTSFFGGVILAGIGAFIGYPHDLPTRADVESLQAETHSQLATLQATQAVEESEITILRINLAKISAKLNISVE